MKSEDLERLRAICEKEGFEVLNISMEENDKFYVVRRIENIEVTDCQYEYDLVMDKMEVSFYLSRKPTIKNSEEMLMYLAKQLEQYLNNQ